MAAVTTRAEYTEKVQRLLDDAQKRFQEMELEQMKQGEVEARAKLARAQKAFEERKTELESRLKRARKAGENAWDEAKAGVESAWSELLGAMENARDEFDLEDESAGVVEEQRKLTV